eukprot:7926051-Karenia_brevis.AAC.1
MNKQSEEANCRVQTLVDTGAEEAWAEEAWWNGGDEEVIAYIQTASAELKNVEDAETAEAVAESALAEAEEYC